MLAAIGGSLGWAFGAVWEVGGDHGPDDGRLRCVSTWHTGEGAPALAAVSERLALGPGEGLPGRVLASGEPAWIADAPADANFPRAGAARRSGLARFVATGRGVVLDRRLELTGMHKDGTEFPVELTITRIGLPGPPTFTGYLRDITQRTRAEAALRASRARLVEVADAERRRIQRNLHDGAQ